MPATILDPLALTLSPSMTCHGPGQPGADLWLLAVADGLDEQLAQWPPLELELAEHVEHLPAERLACLLGHRRQPRSRSRRHLNGGPKL